MKIVSAIDSFKGCASSEELNDAALSELPAEIWQEKYNVPIADGGEGTMEAIYAVKGGKWRLTKSVDPLNHSIEGKYLITTFKGKTVAIIEAAVFIGLHLLTPTDKTIRKATSYGLGIVIKDALKYQVDEIYVTLGGSATSDGGLGMLAALGVFSSNSSEDNLLLSVTDFSFNPTHLFTNTKLYAIADVTNPYTGKHGFSQVFAPQKGADTTTVSEMEHQAKQLAHRIKEQYGIDVTQLKGAGAAGGLGGALVLLGGSITAGFPAIAEMIGLEKIIQDADLVFTGEGKIDDQTEQGKVPLGVARLAQKHKVPVIALCGSRTQRIGTMEKLTLGAFCVHLKPVSEKEALDKQQTLTSTRTIAYSLSNIFLANITNS